VNLLPRAVFSKAGLVVAAAALAACAASAPPATTAKATGAKKGAVAKPAPKPEEQPVLVVAQPEPGKVFSTWTVDKRHRRGETRGKGRTAVPFDIATLPVAVVPDAFLDKDAPGDVTGDAAAEVFTQRHNYGYYGSYGYDRSYNTVMIKGEGFSSGSIKISTSEGAFQSRDGQAYGGVSVMCGKDEINRAARWEGVVKAKDSTEPVYQIVDGWFDNKKCRGVAVRRTKIKLAPIVQDAVYGFRQCSDADCKDKASVVLVIPNANSAVSQSGPIRAPTGAPSSRITIPLRRGLAESVLATVYSPVSPYTQRSVAIEIVQGIEDDQPYATAFLDEVR
jgi:hypothetical protein